MKAESGLILIKKRYGRFVRAVAVFFLLFTGADILMPQYFCDDEIGGISLPTAAATLTAQEHAGDRDFSTVAVSDDSRSRPPSDTSPHEEDCFCCCAHILPSLPIAPGETFEARQPMAAFVNDPLPSPPLQSTYHPPRIA